MRNKFVWIFIAILFSIPAILALFHVGFFQSDDGEWMIIRFSAFHQALRDGQFPVRFLSRLNYGYGYPIANFLYPGFMYFGEVLKLLGFGFVDTIKIIFGLSMTGSAVFAYLWLSKLFSKWPSLVGSFLYLYAPYHLYDIYKRGSVGEILALCVAPFIFWQIERRSFLWTSLGISFLILSHNTLAVLFLPIITLYLISRGLAWTVYFLPAIALGFGLASFFWIPAIFDLRYVIFQKIQISEWQNYFASLSLIGIVPVLVIVWCFLKLRFMSNRTVSIMFYLNFISLFLSLPISSFVWKFLPVSFIQFPFRFLSVTILLTGFLAAFFLNKIKGKTSFLLGGAFIMIIFFSSFSYLTPQAFFDKGDLYYATNEDTTTVRKEYMPIWISSAPAERYREKVEIVNGEISDLKVSSNNVNFVASSAKNTEITINTVYFPGWKAFVDNKKVKLNYANNGLIKISMPSGTHTIGARFGETPIRILSNLISLSSLLMLLFIAINLRKNFLFKS